MSAKPSNYNSKPYLNNENKSNIHKNDENKLKQINNHILALRINEEKDISYSNLEEKVKKKKKTSLLRRTTSVPKLIGCVDIIEKEQSTEIKSKIINSDVKKNDYSFNSQDNNQLKPNDMIILKEGNFEKPDLLHISHNEGENKLESKKDLEMDLEDENEMLTELNSPYNELFFYLFENLLEEFMKLKFKKT